MNIAKNGEGRKEVNEIDTPYANQWSITIVDNEVDKTPYNILTRNARIEATRRLDDGTVALPLYLYLAENADGYNLAFSPSHIKKELGFSPERTRRGRDSLVKNGYLVAVSEREYHFYHMPVDVGVDNDIHVDHSSTNEDMYVDAGNPHREDGEPVCTDTRPVCADTRSNIINTIHTINNISISETIDDNNLPIENDMYETIGANDNDTNAAIVSSQETIEAIVENDTEAAIVSQNEYNIINLQKTAEEHCHRPKTDLSHCVDCTDICYECEYYTEPYDPDYDDNGAENRVPF